MVTQISPDRQITAVNNREGVLRLKPKSIVLAMGCRERSRGQLNVPNGLQASLPPGTAQRFVNVEGWIPGKKAVILGPRYRHDHGSPSMLEGTEVRAVVEILPYIGGLTRNEVQCLHDFHIPLLLAAHTVTEIHGQQRLEAVTIAKVNKDKKPVKDTERRIECDTLLLSVGLIPENELSRMAGVMLDPLSRGPVVDQWRETNVSGIFAGGNVVHVHDLVDDVSGEAEIAGAQAAKFAQKEDLKKKGK